jgi:hypothetical protein
MKDLERIELARLIGETLKNENVRVWYTPEFNSVGTNATITRTQEILGEFDYPKHLIQPGNLWSKGRPGEFITIIKTSSNVLG